MHHRTWPEMHLYTKSKTQKILKKYYNRQNNAIPWKKRKITHLFDLATLMDFNIWSQYNNNKSYL